MIRALKGCCFAGKKYFAGEIVPESAVDKKSIGALIKMKIITVEPEKIFELAENPKPKRGRKK